MWDGGTSGIITDDSKTFGLKELKMMVMLCVGTNAVHVVDNVGKPPCSLTIFQHYCRQIQAVVLSELYSSHKSTFKQNSWFIVKASSFFVIMLCVSAMMAVTRKNLYKNIQREISIDDFTSSVHFYIEILLEDGHNGWNIKHNFVWNWVFFTMNQLFWL